MDPTAGITLFSFDFPTGDLVVGDSVEAEGNVSEFRGLLQLQPTKEITIISQGVDLPTPKVISLAQVGDDFESQLVTVEGVRFVESGNFEGGTNYRIANNAGDTLAFRVGLDNHPLVDTAIPTDYVDVTGTIGQFDDFQLTVESTDAIVLAPKEPILEANVEGNGFDFGSVEAGTQSAAQSFTVSGENLTEDVSVTVPAGYELSLAETTGFDSAIDPLIIDQAGVLVETTIYVRFAPDAAVTGVISGEITLASGDLSEVVAVTGTATEPTTTANKAKLEGVKAYPNPTATFINVEIADNTKEFTYQVVALDGSVLVNGKAFVSERIDISAVETGMYILEITQGQKAFVTRIVKH
jgi:DNA/RNA endonuclease YhcR with UshA esterase domain